MRVPKPLEKLHKTEDNSRQPPPYRYRLQIPYRYAHVASSRRLRLPRGATGGSGGHDVRPRDADDFLRRHAALQGLRPGQHEHRGAGTKVAEGRPLGHAHAWFQCAAVEFVRQPASSAATLEVGVGFLGVGRALGVWEREKPECCVLRFKF